MLFFSVCSIFYNYILNCQPSLVNYYLGYPFNASNINPDNSSASSGLSLMHCLAASRPCPSFLYRCSYLGTAFLDNIQLRTQVYDLASLGNTFAEHDVELCFAEREVQPCSLQLSHVLVTFHFVTIFQCSDLADIQTN